MSAPAPPIECEVMHPGLPVRDVRAAIDFYTSKLGFFLGFTAGEPPHLAGVNLGHVQVFLERGAPQAPGATVYFVVDDVDSLHAFHQANGVIIVEAPRDRDYGMREYSVRDLDGHLLGFAQHTFHAGPPVRIERVDVPVRLEKRLAALLAELAAHKRMSVGSCLEEMILHTNDGVGPHTKAQLALIQRLKAKHGIDYDTHASYRFTEG